LGDEYQKGGPIMDNIKESILDELKENATDEDIAEALAELASKRAYKKKVEMGLVKGAKKVSEMNEEELKAYRASTQKASARLTLTIQKAKAAGITVSDEEIDEYLAGKAKG
jgi:hypothetical protein